MCSVWVANPDPHHYVLLYIPVEVQTISSPLLLKGGYCFESLDPTPRLIGIVVRHSLEGFSTGLSKWSSPV